MAIQRLTNLYGSQHAYQNCPSTCGKNTHKERTQPLYMHRVSPTVWADLGTSFCSILSSVHPFNTADSPLMHPWVCHCTTVTHSGVHQNPATSSQCSCLFPKSIVTVESQSAWLHLITLSHNLKMCLFAASSTTFISFFDATYLSFKKCKN